MPPARIAAAAGMAALSLALCGQASAQKPPTSTSAGGRPPARPAPPPRIEGTVRDAAGKPIEKALVLVRPVAADRLARTISGRTDASGRFALEVPRPAIYLLRVEAPGLAPHTVERLTVPTAALAVTLRKGGVIEGVVRDGRGKPVAGARVDARVSTRLGTLLSEPDAGRVRATTDAKGAFRLEGLAITSHSVIASAAGIGGARRDGVSPGAKLDVYLTPGAGVQGVVRGPDRRPLAGAAVLIAPDTFGPVGSNVERTDAAGLFQARGLRPGAWHAIAAHPDFAPALAPVFLERNAEQRVELTLGAPARLKGRLVDGEGRPVRGALMLQELEGQVVAQSLGEMLRAESDAQGRFTLERVPRAPLALGVTARDYMPRRIEAAPEAAELDLGDVVLERGLAIRGRVRDTARQAIGDAQVHAMLQSRGGGPAFVRLEATSDADGTFVLAGAEPGMYHVSAEAAGFAADSTQAPAGGEPVELTLTRAGSISGTVVDEKGAPVPAFNVTATPSEKEAGYWRPAFGDGSDGRFELLDLAAGDWVVQVKAPEKAEARVSGVKVRTGAATDVGRIRLVAGASVRGRVTDSAGSPVAGAGVWPDTPGRFAPVVRSGQRGTFTDASGAFELLGVEAGRIDLVADHPDFATGRLSGVDVDAARGASDLRLTLSRGGRIEGTARRRDGRPLERAIVRVMAPGPSGPSAMAALAPDGSFALEHVAPGTVRLVLGTNVVNGASSTSQQKQIEVREGETTSADFLVRDIVVSGTVTRRGEPAPGARIAVRGMTGPMFSMPTPGAVPAAPNGPQYGFAVARADGGYELLVAEPGKYTASVTSADGRINYAMRSIEVPDADATTADLAFGGALVSGQVVDAETSAPLSATVFAAPKVREEGRPANTQTGPDGRFQLELEPGEFTLAATSEGYAAARSSVSVGENGAADLRLALTRGATISGRIVDAAGKPVGSLMVTASPEGDVPLGGVPVTRTGFGSAAADGTFTITSLSEGRYALSTGDELAGFGVTPDVAAGSKDVVLRLVPGGRVRATVLRPDGTPAQAIFVTLAKVDGRQIMLARSGAQTDAAGVAEFAVPPGSLEFRAGDPKLDGSASGTVAPGETASVEIRLEPRKKDPGTR